MAEGGTESLRNNLCQNQEKKVVEEKDVQQRTGYPELALSDFISSVPLGLINGRPPPTIVPVHQYSRHSETELKDMLDKAPLLTPSASDLNVSDRADQLPRSDSSIKISNVDPSPVTSDPGAGDSQSLPAGACKANQLEEPASDAGCSSIMSSYIRAGFVSPSSMEVSSPSTAPNPSSSFLPSQEDPNGTTNNLSAPKAGPPPSTFHPMMGAAAYGSMMGGVMPVLCYPMIPMGCDPSGAQAPVMTPMFASQPFHPMSQSMGPTPLYMTPNISYGTMGMNGATAGHGVIGGNGVTGGNGGNRVTGGSPLTATFGAYNSQQNLDSRNIPVNGAANSAPSSEENSSQGSRSYSINPGKDTRLTRLRGPVLQWIKTQLERQSSNNWEAVADRRGWNYQEIRDHLTECRHNKESPFLKMLESEAFCTYTVQEFMEDMRRIGRKDILMDFGAVLQNNRP